MDVDPVRFHIFQAISTNKIFALKAGHTDPYHTAIFSSELSRCGKIHSA
jgi:hypothetical protein